MAQHVARIAKIDKIEAIPGADRVQVAIVFGFSVIVGKASQVGDLGVFFEAGDTQLSEDFCKNNNLYRHSEYNIDKAKVGYVQDNGRLKVEKMLKVKSEGLFMPLDSLKFAGDISTLKLGDAFDEFNKVKICNKFISEETRKASSNKVKAAKKNMTPLFKEHLDTEQLAYYIDKLKVGDRITIYPKWHGTSGRTSYTKVITHKLSFWNKIKRFLKLRFDIIEEANWHVVTGTRRVVLSNQDKTKEGYHSSEAYRFEITEMLAPYLIKGQSVYYEIVGYVNGKSIMPQHSTEKLDKEFRKKYGEKVTYSYGCKETQFKTLIYRIVYTTDSGDSIDFTPEQLQEWCSKRNINHTVPIYDCIYDGNKETLWEKVKELGDRPDCLTEDYEDSSHPSEGVIIRVDNGKTTPQLYKYKSWVFKVMENLVKETGVDTEDAESSIETA